MQEYKKIKKLLKFVEELTDNISSKLDKDDEHNKNDVLVLFNQRKKALQELKSEAEKDNSRDFLDDPHNNWNERISLLMKKDKLNLQKLEKKTKGLGEDLKKIYKQKNLLIYKDR